MLPTDIIPKSSANPNLAKGFDPSSLIATGLTTVVDMLIKKNDAKKAAELQAKIELLTVTQQKELEQKLRSTVSEIDRYAILYKTIAVSQNSAVLDKLKATKNKNIILLAIGIGCLTLLILISKKNKP